MHKFFWKKTGKKPNNINPISCTYSVDPYSWLIIRSYAVLQEKHRI